MFVWLCLFDFLCLLRVWHWLKDARVWSHKSNGQARVVLMFWQMHHLQGRSRDHCQNTIGHIVELPSLLKATGRTQFLHSWLFAQTSPAIQIEVCIARLSENLCQVWWRICRRCLSLAYMLYTVYSIQMKIDFLFGVLRRVCFGAAKWTLPTQILPVDPHVIKCHQDVGFAMVCS